MEQKNVNMNEETIVEETINQTNETDEANCVNATEAKQSFFEKHPKVKFASKVAGTVLLSTGAIIGGGFIVKGVINKEVAKQVTKAIANAVPKQIEMKPDIVDNFVEAAKEAGAEVVEF